MMLLYFSNRIICLRVIDLEINCVSLNFAFCAIMILYTVFSQLGNCILSHFKTANHLQTHHMLQKFIDDLCVFKVQQLAHGTIIYF